MMCHHEALIRKGSNGGDVKRRHARACLLRIAAVAGVLWCGWAPAGTIVPTDTERTETRQWASTHFDSPEGVPPFSFTCDGKPFPFALANKRIIGESSAEHSACARYSVIWTDPVSGLEVRCQTSVYSDYPVAEWVVYLTNTGKEDSPPIENINALNAMLPCTATSAATVYHGRGSECSYSDFALLVDALAPGGRLAMGSHGRPGNRSGISSVEALPFFNVAAGDGGMLAGIGWTGSWASTVERSEQGDVSVQAGLEPVHIRLHPGESIRTPRIAILFWKGDRLRAHNLWRAFLRDYFSPAPGGKPFAGLIADGNWGSWMPVDRHIAEIQWWRDHDLPMECYWVDAGWTDMRLGWEAHQSHQEPNADLFPEGMKPLSDAARARDMKFLLWMVPSSVHPAVGLGKEHPEWLGEPYGDKAYGAMVFHGLDLGNPDITRAMVGHFSEVIDRFGVDVFRQDGGNLWPADDEPERVGMRQIRYVQGCYDFWDGLIAKHPDMLIDNCAEGGRRLDLETIRRSIVLWRSDSQASGDFDPVSNQGFTYGLLSWIPLCGAPVPITHLTPYAFRSAYAPAIVMCWPMVSVPDVAQRWKDIDIDLLRKLLKEYVALRPCLFGDFYPLTGYSLDAHEWMAWQWDLPDKGRGFLQAFRRPECAETTHTCALHGLDPAAVYTVVNLDEGQPKEYTGQALMSAGVAVCIPEQPGAAIVAYEKAAK